MWNQYITPADLPTALDLLQSFGQRARLVAGGTDLVLDFSSGRVPPVDAVIDISCLPELRGIRLGDGLLTIGAGVTFTEILRSRLLCENVPVLAQAAETIAGPQIRNSATIGGNVVNGSPAADAVPALLALDSSIFIAGPGSLRTIRLEDFLLGVRRVQLLPGEIVSAFQFPVPSPATRQYFRKVQPRRAMAIAILNLAILVEVAEGCIRRLHIATGAVAPTAIRLHALESALVGGPIAAALDPAPYSLVADEILPITDFRASCSYRTRVAQRLLRESLIGLLAGMEAP